MIHIMSFLDMLIYIKGVNTSPHKNKSKKKEQMLNLLA